ncbi:MAG TPA: STAS domain-containing protein [Anaerolineaceae bacterium]|jgi:anti-sigma B factor antagonist|nr:STAS domain-containing protein [Anaerolineaceae bacterium]
MEIITTNYKRCDLVKVNGRVDSATAPQLAEVFDSVMNGGQHKIVFDMSDIDYISSSGLRVMINAQKNCKRYNRGEVILVNIPPRVYAALDLAGFIPFFKIFDEVTTAVAQF